MARLPRLDSLQPPDRRAADPAADPSRHGLAAVLMKSANGGAMGLAVDAGIGRGVTVCSMAVFTGTTTTQWPAGTLVAGLTCGRVCFSTDGGANWVWSMADLACRSTIALAPTQKNGLSLFAGDTRPSLLFFQ